MAASFCALSDRSLPETEKASLYFIEVLSRLADRAIILVPSSTLLSYLFPMVASTMSRLSMLRSMLSFSECISSLSLLMKPVRSASANAYGLIWDILIRPFALADSRPDTARPVLFLMNCPKVSKDMPIPPSMSKRGSSPSRSDAEPFRAMSRAFPFVWKSLMIRPAGAPPPPFTRMSAAMLLSILMPLCEMGLSGMLSVTSIAGILPVPALYHPSTSAFMDIVASVFSFDRAGMSCLPQNLRISFILHRSIFAFPFT